MNPKIYQDALDCQNACNLSGVLHTFAKHMPEIGEECNHQTELKNRHPAVQLFLSKLVSLTGGEYYPDYEVWSLCEQRAGRKAVEV